MRSRTDLLWVAALLIVAAVVGVVSSRRQEKSLGRPERAKRIQVEVLSRVCPVPTELSAPAGGVLVIILDSCPNTPDIGLRNDTCLRGPGRVFQADPRDHDTLESRLRERFPGLQVQVYKDGPGDERPTRALAWKQEIQVAAGGMLVLGKGLPRTGSGVLVVALGPPARTAAIRDFVFASSGP